MIDSAVCWRMSSATGTGWYGEPFQQTPATDFGSPQSRVRALTERYGSADRAGDPGQQPLLHRCVEPVQQGPVHRDHPRGAVGHQRTPHVVDDQARGRAGPRPRAPTGRRPGPGSPHRWRPAGTTAGRAGSGSSVSTRIRITASRRRPRVELRGGPPGVPELAGSARYVVVVAISALGSDRGVSRPPRAPAGGGTSASPAAARRAPAGGRTPGRSGSPGGPRPPGWRCRAAASR